MSDDTLQNQPDAKTGANAPARSQQPEAEARARAAAEEENSNAGMPDGDIDALLHAAEETVAQTRRAIESEQDKPDGEGHAAALSAGPVPAPRPAFAGQSASFPELSHGGSSGSLSNLDLLDDVELDVKIELGRAEMYVEDVLRLGVGSVVELDKLAGDPVDVYVNDRLVARGEVLVLNDNFCVRVNEILSPANEAEDPA